MRITMRAGVFETNSSSTHSLVICTQKEFSDWKDGSLLYDRDWCKFVPVDEANMEDEDADWIYLTYNDVFDWDGKIGLETFHGTYTTPGGEDVVAFGWYGYEG